MSITAAIFHNYPTTYKKILYEDALRECLEYFEGDELASSVFLSKYALRDNDGDLVETTPRDMHTRVAHEFARIESKKFKDPLSFEKIFSYLDHYRKIMPQGSPCYGIGNPFTYVSISNCFVVDSPTDSYGGILNTDQQIIQISKRRGGVGTDISNIRPSKSLTRNSSRTSTGIIPFMERYSNSIREVGQDGRRGALMLSISVHHPEVLEFAKVKNDAVKVTGANISVRLSNEFLKAVDNDEMYEQRWPVDSKTPTISKMVRARDVWDALIYNAWFRAEPGLLFWDLILEESPADCYGQFGYSTQSTNPCLTGQTKVYVADGRGIVTIKELAEQESDVDIFCFDNNGKIVIRKMRNPRITGYKQQIYKVTLDDGSIIRTTGNHKFLLNNGNYKEVKDLVYGDSLKIITKEEASLKDIWPTANSRSQDYYWLNTGLKNWKSEHRIIAEHYYGDILPKSVVHHKDYNAKNNAKSNLEIMTKEDHDHLHSADMLGDKNPMRRAQTEWSEEKWNRYRKNMSDSVRGEKNGRYSGYTNQEIYDHAIKLSINLGRRFSNEEWQQYAKTIGLPLLLDNSHRLILGGNITALSKIVAQELGFDHIDADTRLVRTLISMKQQGYQAYIKGNEVYVDKYCEKCKNRFDISHNKREVSYCSITCSNIHLNKTTNTNIKRSSSINETYNNKARQTKLKQLDIYTKLKCDLGREPLMKEWEDECEKNKVSYRMRTKHGFKSYKELAQQAVYYNHRVISVELDGFEDVYNGTVDDYHNFFVGGFEGINKYDKPKSIWLNNLQCGELPLSALDSCRLTCLNTYTYVKNKFTSEALFNYDEFYKDTQVAQRMMDNVIDLELEAVEKIINKIKEDPEPDNIKLDELTLWQRIWQTAHDGRRTGLGLTGMGDTLAALGIKYDSDLGIETVEKIYKTLKLGSYRASVDMAKELGPFPIWNWELEKNNPFINRIKDEDPVLYEDIKKYGRRNIANLTTAPVGSGSTQSQTTSGIECIFDYHPYDRRKKINPSDTHTRVDFVDAKGDKWQTYKVYHKPLKDWMVINHTTDIEKSPYVGSEANALDWKQRVKLQAAAQRHVDHSISSTVNIPESATVEDVSNIYMTAWKAGCKGITVYRDKCRDGVLLSNSKKEEETKITHTTSPKRPIALPADIHNIKIKGESITILVGLLNGDPYEVMMVHGHISGENGKIIKVKRGHYKLVDNKDEVLYEDINETSSDNEEALTRLASTALRHGSNIQYVCEQLSKVKGDFMSLSKGIARVLKKYIEDGKQASGASCSNCNSANLVYTEGCQSCRECGHSKCS
jgi:ribonucleotide reductase alpha subunit